MTVSKNIRQDSGLVQLRDVVECLAVIKDLHPNWNISDETRLAKTWFYSLKQYKAHDVKKATLEIASTSRYIPKLADVLEVLEKQSNSVKIEYHDDVQELQNYMDSLGNEELKQFHRNVENYLQDNSYELDQFEMRYAKLYLETKQKLDEITGRI